DLKVHAYSDWLDMSPETAPSARMGSKLVYDRESDRVILFSGHSDPTTLGFYGTWVYDFNANIWTNQTPSSSPSPRSLNTMAYDVESDRVIMFGGVRISTPLSIPFEGLNDTWAYDFNTNTWTQMNPSMRPRARAGAAMVYDVESDRTILFGGFTETRTYLNDTWAYDFNNNTWVQMNPAIAPSVRYLPGLAYDEESDRVIFFGGNHYTSTSWIDEADTWVYDYNSDNWTNMNPASTPPRRGCPNFAYNLLMDRVILFGGVDKYKSFSYSDTWVYNFNDNTWTEMICNFHPPGRFYSDMTYYIESNRVILFAGTNDKDVLFNDTGAYEYHNKSETSNTNSQSRTSLHLTPVLFFLSLMVVVIVQKHQEHEK
ncbi:MAG: Kelch repeat-containing protein, partial [Candidatus Hodarchaeota archaeon]